MSIGANGLSEAVYKLEETLDQEKDDKEVIKQLENVAKILDKVVKSIEYFEKEHSTKESSQIQNENDLVEITPIIEELKKYLQTYSSKANGCFKKLKSPLSSLISQDKIELLEKHLMNYDFESALEKLIDIIEILELLRRKK